MPASPDIARPLRPFVRSNAGPVRALAASVERQGEAVLRFRYVLDADPGTVRIPALSAPRQADELWKHTCFEAFIGGPRHDEAYRELNFSPSTEWAAYAFERYRAGMKAIALPSTPRIEVTHADSRLVVEASVEVEALLPESWRASGTSLRIALSAVIEDESGRISYWALEHAPDKPDFHHAAGFILEV